jgi:hypothetical protein
VLQYIPNSSVKLYQVIGDCDWTEWDATIASKTPTCKPTVSQTATKADVLGNDTPVVFENNGEMIITFGDTIGAAGYAAWTTVQNFVYLGRPRSDCAKHHGERFGRTASQFFHERQSRPGSPTAAATRRNARQHGSR